MKFILILLVSTLLGLFSLAEEPVQQKQPTDEQDKSKKSDETKKASSSEVETQQIENPWFLGAGVSLLNFSSVGFESIQYNIDSNLWTALQGSYKFRSGLRVALNANFDTKLVKNGLAIAGQVSSDNMVIQFINGKFTGAATLTDSFNGTTYTQTDNEVSTKYLAVDALFKNWFACDGCISGIRYIQYDIPAEIGFNTEVLNKGSASILDPALRIQGALLIGSFSTQRDYVLGADGSKVKKASVPVGMVQGLTQSAKLGNSFALEGHTGVGFGVAKVSDRGKANLSSVTGGRSFEDDGSFLILYETSVAALWAYNGLNKSGTRWSVGAGYMFQISSAINQLSFAEPNNSSQATISDISVGYTMHGPRANFFMVF